MRKLGLFAFVAIVGCGGGGSSPSPSPSAEVTFAKAGDIFASSRTGGNQIRLTSDGGNSEPQGSGRRIVFKRVAPGDPDPMILEVDATTKATKFLTRGESPDVAPNGDVVFIRHINGVGRKVLIRSGVSEREIAPNALYPRFNTTGQVVTFSVPNGEVGYRQLHGVRASDGQELFVIDMPVLDSCASNTHVFFGANKTVWRADLNGQNIVRLTENEGENHDVNITVSPDGQTVYFIRSNTVMTVPADGSAPATPVTSFGDVSGVSFIK